MRKFARKIMSFMLKYLPTGRVSNLLLWPSARRIFGKYTETVRPDANFRMKLYGDMPDMINKSLLFMSDYKVLAWEPVTARLVKRLAPSIRTAVVAGAYIGYYPLILTANNPEIRVFAFEPDRLNYSRLLENLRLNDAQNVETFPLGLGNKNEEKKMFFDFGQSSFVDSSRKHSGEGLVSVTTLDHFFQNRPEVPDLVLLDAEGYEPWILEGGRSIIYREKPDIIFEINPRMLEISGSSTGGLVRQIQGLGYNLFIIDDDYQNYPNNRSEPEIGVLKYNGSFLRKFPAINVFATINPERISRYIKQ